MALDCTGHENSQQKLILWKSIDAPNQKWIFIQDAQGNYTIQCSKNGRNIMLSQDKNDHTLNVSEPKSTAS